MKFKSLIMLIPLIFAIQSQEVLASPGLIVKGAVKVITAVVKKTQAIARCTRMKCKRLKRETAEQRKKRKATEKAKSFCEMWPELSLSDDRHDFSKFNPGQKNLRYSATVDELGNVYIKAEYFTRRYVKSWPQSTGKVIYLTGYGKCGRKVTLKRAGKRYAIPDNAGHWIHLRFMPSPYNWDDWQIDRGLENASLREIFIKHFPNFPKEMQEIRAKQSKMK